MSGHKLDLRKATIAQLARLYPACFYVARRERRPLKIGIRRDLAALDLGIGRRALDSALGFAARIFQMHDPRVIIDTITRGSVDGGRDAIGRYLLGLSDDPVYAEFSLEAKCYQPGFDEASTNTGGVREVSRLISRIRHRQFGVLVTTSVIARQAYEEVREDRHPIIFFSGKDIADILINNGFNTPELAASLLNTEFPLTETA